MGRPVERQRPTPAMPIDPQLSNGRAERHPVGRRIRRLCVGQLPLAIAAAAMTLTASSSCALRGGPPTRGENISAVAGDADHFVGHRVTLVGRVGEVVSAKSFTITDGVERVLVLDVSVAGALDNDLDGVVINEEAKVTGVLHILAIDKIEQYVGELTDHRYERFVGEPVLVADAVRPRLRRGSARR